MKGSCRHVEMIEAVSMGKYSATGIWGNWKRKWKLLYYWKCYLGLGETLRLKWNSKELPNGATQILNDPLKLIHPKSKGATSYI